MAVLAALLALLVGLVAALCLWLRRRHSYWRSRGVPGPTPSIPFGNCTAACLGRRAVYEDFFLLYRRYQHEPYFGIFYAHTPLLVINDLDLIKQVVVKEFHDFNGRGMYSDPEREPLSGNLFIISGQAWRNLRVKLSPAFTSGKMKYYFTRVQECAASLQQHLEKRTAAGGGSYREEVRDLVARYTTDIIASLIFGLESDSTSRPDSELRVMGKKALEPSFLNGVRFNLLFFARDLMKALNIRMQGPEVHEFFRRIVGETVAYREAHGVERADLLNLLIQLKNKGFLPPDKDDTAPATEDNLTKLTMSEIIAQVFVFYTAGFETSSTTTSFVLYELAKNPHVLEKLIAEVDQVLEEHNGEITYEAVHSLPYMDKVLNETLRLYPAVPFLTREVMRRRTLPGTDLVLEAGTTLLVPVSGIQRNPEYWPDPDLFDPERFSEKNKSSIHSMAHLPFGNGPRICIGMRLGEVQVKSALLALLSRCSVSRCPDTPDAVQIEPWSIVPAPKGGLPVTLTRRRITTFKQ